MVEFSHAKDAASSRCDGLIVAIYAPEDGSAPKLPGWAAHKTGEFLAGIGQISVVQNAVVDGTTYAKAVLLGLGPKSKCTPRAYAGAYASAFSALKSGFCSRIAMVHARAEWTAALVSQVLMADYSFDKYKSPKPKGVKIPAVDAVALVCASDVRAAMEEGRLLGTASNRAREIQNEPANVASPHYVAKIAKALAAKNGLEYSVLGRAELEKQGMNAMLAVASGSANEPQLVVLRYKGNPKSSGTDVALVGKGVTFDSGGISLKPSAAMDEMKFDKSGACAVIATMSALKGLGVKKNVVGIAALVENLPSGQAYRPGDIVRARNGKTIEVLNTDAEGRVVLADALSYAVDTFKPAVLLDYATLTGACVVALGDLAAGLMSPDPSLARELGAASQAACEPVWELPSWEEYDDKVKSDVADVKNIGEKGTAGTIAGFSFLRPFATPGPRWAHLDIAGTSWLKAPKWGLGLGGTGFGVRLTLRYLLSE